MLALSKGRLCNAPWNAPCHAPCHAPCYALCNTLCNAPCNALCNAPCNLLLTRGGPHEDRNHDAEAGRVPAPHRVRHPPAARTISLHSLAARTISSHLLAARTTSLNLLTALTISLQPTPHTLHGTSYIVHLTSYTLHRTPYIVQASTCTCLGLPAARATPRTTSRPGPPTPPRRRAVRLRLKG